MKAISSTKAKKILQRIGMEQDDDIRTFYATNKQEQSVWKFDSKKRRDAFVAKANKGDKPC